MLVAVAAVFVSSPVAAAPSRERQPKWDPRIVKYVRFVEKERGLRFDQPIPVRFLSDAAFRKAVRDDEEVTASDRRDARAASAQLHALGLAEAGVDLLDAAGDDAEGTVSGFYNQVDERMVIRGKRLDDIDVRVTVVHELTHALQDQRFNFDRIERDIDTTSQDLAYAAILEGDAILVEDAYIGTLSQQEQDAYYADAPEGVEPPATVPAILDAELSAPYVVGPAFIDFVSTRGKKARNRAITRPPPSDEQVIDPVAYVEHQRPERVKTPALEAGERRHGSADELGAVGLYLVLASRLDISEALAAATGWAGDRYIGFTRGGRDCVRATVAADTTGEAKELVAALGHWASRGPAGAATVAPVGPKRATVTACADDAATPPTYESLSAALDVLGERIYFYAGVESPKVDPRDARCLADHFATDPRIVELSYEQDLSAADDQFVADRTTAYARECAVPSPS